MGKRGPKPTPTHILAIRGSRAAEGRTDAPTLPGVPDAPEWLVGEALEEWHRQIDDLRRRNLLTLSDRPSLALYCAAWGEFVTAEKHLAEHGATEVTTRGNSVLSAWVRIRNASRDAVAKLGAQFGFSPSTRAGLAPSEPPQDASTIAKRDRFFK